MRKKVKIIAEDEYILVINKPPDYLTLPDRYAPDLPNVLQFLTHQFGKVYTVHRLDKETSGVLVFARDEDSHRALSQQFEYREVQKQYYAVVEGQLHQQEGTIDKPIGPHPSGSGRMIIKKKGKPSVTHYRLVEQYQHFALIAVTIETGRTHQIRVHFQSIGYPLAVDSLYGRRQAFYLSMIKARNYRLAKDEIERPLLSRTSLHAWSLTFRHPATGDQQCFEAALPKDLAALVNQLRKWDS